MRLPWPFGRTARSAPASPGGSPPDGAPAPERASGDAWRRLPPLAETVGPPPLVAPNRPFAAALAANELPAPILAPLSHGRSLEAPRGLVSGIARPTAGIAGPALPAPVQRSPLGRRRAAAADPGDDWPEDSGAVDLAPPPPEAAPGLAPSPEPSLPARRLAVVAVATPSAPLLTRAPEPKGAGIAGLIGQPRAAGAGRSPLSVAGSPSVQRAPAAPGARASAPPVGPPSPVPSTLQTAAAPHLTIGQARRLGLGAPVAGGPVTSTAAPFREVDAMAPLSRSAPAARGTVRDAAVGVQRAPEPSAPDLPLATRSMVAADESGPAHQHPEPAALAPLPTPPAAPAAIARLVGPPDDRAAIPAGKPIVSAQPLRSRVQRAPLTLPQRAAEHAAASAPSSAAPFPATAGGPVKVHRDGPASQLSTALDARSFTHGGEIFLPASQGPLTSGPGKALLAHEMTHVAQQRRLGSSLPAEHTPHGKSLEAEAVAAERSPDMPLAFPSGPAGTTTAPTSALALPGATAAHGPGPQRAAAEDGAPTRPPATGRTSGGSSRAAGHTHTEQELEVLAHQLYHRIGRHLRRELLVDRERIGFALDMP